VSLVLIRGGWRVEEVEKEGGGGREVEGGGWREEEGLSASSREKLRL
jgi:hypothetical protein